MNDPTINLINHALQQTLADQTAIAVNIANVNSADHPLFPVDANQEKSVSASSTVFANKKPGALDEQLVHALQNTARIRALIKGLNHYLGLMKLALQGNNL